jgi:membrane-associated phospholipid phosphatase
VAGDWTLAPLTGRRGTFGAWSKMAPLAAALAFSALALLAEAALDGEVWRWDVLTPVRAGRWARALLDPAMHVGTGLGGGLGATILSAAMVGVVLRHGTRCDAVFVTVCVMVAPATGRVMKRAIGQARPTVADPPVYHSVAVVLLILAGGVAVALLATRYRSTALTTAAAFVVLAGVDTVVDRWLLPLDSRHDAFPSGHATSSMALVAAAVTLVWPSPRARRAAVVVGPGFLVLVGWSRVYFAAHQPTAVLAGWCLGVVVVAIANRLIRRRSFGRRDIVVTAAWIVCTVTVACLS